MLKLTPVLLAGMLAMIPQAASAAEISTHVLDLARGVGGQGVPVTLSKKLPSGGWVLVARASTDGKGRVGAFASSHHMGTGIYKLHFDMSRYPQTGTTTPFFPEIEVAFQVSDPGAHYHVPVVVSPYGYSTYRGN